MRLALHELEKYYECDFFACWPLDILYSLLSGPVGGTVVITFLNDNKMDINIDAEYR